MLRSRIWAADTVKSEGHELAKLGLLTLTRFALSESRRTEQALGCT